MDISAFTISRVTQQAQGSIVSASVLIMIEMKSLVNYKFYKERGRSKISWSWNDYTKESLFSWCVKCEVTYNNQKGQMEMNTGSTSTRNGKTRQPWAATMQS
jgi:hypothetical protein